METLNGGGGPASLHRHTSSTGSSSSVLGGASHYPTSSNNSGSPLAAGLLSSSSKQDAPAMDAWIVQKLKNEWSSCEFGGLLTKDKISDAVTSFRHLDTPIKVRFLLSFLSMRREDIDESKFAIVEIIDAAENDTEEWVKIGAGVVKQYVFMSEDGSESGDTFHHEQIAKTIARVLEAVNSKKQQQEDDWEAEEFFCHEDAFLNPSVRPETRVKPIKHFTIVASSPRKDEGVHEKASERKTALHRPQMPRPLPHASASSAVPRAVPTTSKPPPPKKNVTELSEIRRKADAGRFKRHRSRISMIDIDEVKQIESEKAQKAEERKKQKVVAAKGEKSTGGSGHTNEKGNGSQGNDDQHDEQDEPSSTALESSHHEDHETSHGNVHDDDDQDDHDDDGGAADHTSAGHHRSSDDERTEYIPDGTQALLNAAFHSTKDIMTEVVSQQQSMHHQSHPLHHHSLYEQEQQQQQQSYHRGFEPEDATTHHMPYGYGFNSTYSSHFGDQGHLQQQQHQYPYQQQQLHQQQLHNQYGAGFMDDQVAQPPVPGQYRQPGFDGTHHSNHNNGGYMDGPPEYWR
ncbi:hypothetical protein FI667_g1923, partial [Globisporangium splendens]